jgi:uncharacterized protein YciI
MKKLLLLFSVLILGGIYITVKPNNSSMAGGEESTIYYVLFHSPGEKWVDSLSFRDQPGVADHVGYMRSFLESKKLVEGGPFLDNSGGMMVFNVGKEEAEKIAHDDPAVKSGLLKVIVRPWMPAFSSR